MKKQIKTEVYLIVMCISLMVLAVSCNKENSEALEEDEATVTDIDGNVYNTVTIGTQVWMAENLTTTKYKDGTQIPNVEKSPSWIISPGAWCSYLNSDSLKDIYGRLYNWYAVETMKLCPTGWHVPTSAEWQVLINYAGGETIAGDKLKEADTIHWKSPNTGTNETGFTALPGGIRLKDGS